MSLPVEIRRAVRERARDRCEYCGILQARFPLVTFHVEHVIARQHGGSNDLSNLCLAYHWCNLFKGPNLSSIEQGMLVPLFNPRLNRWEEHFLLIDGRIVGLTAIGIATQRILNMNDPDRVELRSD